MTPGQSHCVPQLLTTARYYLYWPPEIQKNWRKTNPNLNDYHSDRIEISNTFSISDITDWWRQQGETHSKYADYSNVAHNTFSIIPPGVGVEASFSIGRDVIGRRQSETTGETVHEKVIVRHIAQANNGLLAGADPEFHTTNTENDFEIKKDEEEWKLPTMAKVRNLLEMWQSCQHLRATKKEFCAQNNQMTAVEYI